MKSYDLNLLAALDALLTSGSVTGAATRMHLSTPAMSHTLARIREAFGDPILVRAGRRLVPTPRALALAEPVRQVLAQARALRDMAGQDWQAQRRRFVVRAQEGWAVAYGASVAQALVQRMPRASLQWLPEAPHDPDALREGRVDLEIGHARVSDALAHAPLQARQPLVGVARADHPLLQGRAPSPTAAAKRARSSGVAVGARVGLARYAEAQHVDVSPAPGEMTPVDRALAQAGLTREVVLLVPSTFTALVAASRSALVATASVRTAQKIAPPLGLVVFRLPFALETGPTRMAWHPRHESDPAHACLRDCVQQVFDTGQGAVPPPAMAPARRSVASKRPVRA